MKQACYDDHQEALDCLEHEKRHDQLCGLYSAAFTIVLVIGLAFVIGHYVIR